MTAAILDSPAKHLFRLLFPKLCLICEKREPKRESEFCLICSSDLSEIEAPSKTAAALEGKDVYPSEIRHTYGLYYFSKGSHARRLMHKIKYQGRKDLARYLGNILGERIKTLHHNWSDYTIIPAPIHAARLKQRGYNQAEIIARSIALTTGAAIQPKALVRKNDDLSQTKKTRSERMSLLRDAISFNNRVKIQTPNVLIVDDVITTGATVRACFEQIFPHCREIEVASLAISI